MTLPWVRLETSYPDNPKVLELVIARRWRAISVYTFGLAWVGRAGTDGFIPDTALRLIHADKPTAAQLVLAGLWDETPGGWLVHDWADYQPSSDEHEQRRKRAQQAALKRWRPD